jgi:PAS domain S-box-containing protein
MLISQANQLDNVEQMAVTLKSIGDGVLTTDLYGNVTFLNRPAELLTGHRSPEALSKKSWEVLRLVDHDSKEPTLCPVQRVLQTGAATGYLNHTLLIDAEGSPRPISYSGTPLRDADGSMQGVVVVFHCVRDKVGAQSASERLHLIAKATNDAVWDWDVPSGKVWWNEAVTTLFGYCGGEVGSDPQWMLDRIHPDDRARMKDHYEQIQADLRYWQEEYRFLSKNGSYSIVHERGYVLRDSEGRAIRLTGTMMDITGRRNAQDELLQINAELEQRIEERTTELKHANRELESFSYSVSHDLRSPLRNILALGHILQEDNLDKLDPEARLQIEGIVRSADRMSKLIDDLLQYSRLSRSRLHLRRVDVTAIAKAAAHNVADPANPVEFVVEEAMHADADSDLLTILYENLIGNAVKFTSKTERPRVEIGMVEQRGEQVFFVRDNGVGFDPRFKDKLFIPFERLHSDDEFQGTGIGLANCARIIRRHGGRIWAEGKVDQGATFYFTL